MVHVKKREPEWLWNDYEVIRHIADVLQPDTGGVIEVQQSHLSMEEAVERVGTIVCYGSRTEQVQEQ